MLSPYNYFYDNSSSTYKFSTKKGIEYSVAFLVDETLNSVTGDEITINNVYQIVIDKLTDTKEPLDARVALTIDNIISAFFLSNENVLIFFCSDSDNKERKRYEAFKRWYKNSPNKKHIDKLDNIIQYDSVKVYSSLLYHNNHPQKSLLSMAFKGIQTIIDNDEK